MKRSLTHLAIWFSCILCLKGIAADGQPTTQVRNQIREFHNDELQTQIAHVEATTSEKTDIGVSALHFNRRDLPIRMGLAANPDVITQDVPTKERRSITVFKRDLPIRMGLAANPDVITQDNVKLERRSALGDETHDVNKLGKQLHSRSMHMGLAANPDVLTQDLPPNQSEKRRRTLEGLNGPSYEAPMLESRSLPRLFGPEESLEMLSEGLNPVISSEKIFASPNSVGRVQRNVVNLNSRFQDHQNTTIVLPQVATEIPLLNLNTVGLGKSVTLPLHRREMTEEDKELHPELRFQQHLNHALKRHAHFLEKSIDEEILQNNLRKRALSVGWTDEQFGVFRRSLLPRQQGPTDFPSQGFPASAFAAAKTGKITPPIPVTAANSIGLHIEANDVGYFAEIQVGTPPATYRFIVDTGSSDAWLQLEDCRNFKDPTRSCNHPTLNPQSSTFKRTSNPFKITYGTGKVMGVLVEETLNMGGLVLNNHVFGGVTRASDEFTGKNVPFDGLMGTAKSILSNQKVLTPIEALAKAGTLSGAFVGYALGRVSDSQNIGQVTFGGIDQTKFSGDLTIFPNVNKKGFWEGAMDVVQVGGKTILTDRTGILDTGTTLMVLPAEDAAVVHSNIPGATSDGKGGFRIPCTNTVKVGLSFGGVIFEINPVDLTFQPVGKNLTGQCLSGISVGTVGGPTQWLVGDVFLKNVYFATDVTNDQMGLAVLNPVPPKK